MTNLIYLTKYVIILCEVLSFESDLRMLFGGWHTPDNNYIIRSEFKCL